MSGQRCSLGVVLAWTILCWMPLPAAAQAPQTKPGDFKIGSIRAQLRRAPDYGGTGTSLGGKAGWANEPWLYVEVEFASDPEWVDDLTVRFYVLMGQGRTQRMFTGDVTHINVKKGNRHYSAMFLHPSTVDRYGQGKVEAVAVQLLHQDRLMDQSSEPTARSRWWEQFTPVPGFLLRPNQTPWSVIAFERFEAEKPVSR